MPTWKHTINLKEEWKTDNPIIVIDKIMSELKLLIPKLLKHEADEAKDLLQAFEEYKKGEGDRGYYTFDSYYIFDNLMESLYNWADEASVWITTII